MIYFFSVLVSGHRSAYTHEWVNRLHAAITRHCNLPHTHVCLTDAPSGKIAPNIQQVDISDWWKPLGIAKGWWAKVKLFDPAILPEATPADRFVYCDLDSLIVSDLVPMLESVKHLPLAFAPHTAPNFNPAGTINTYSSTFMSWVPGTAPQLYTSWGRKVAQRLRGDQDWFGECLPGQHTFDYKYFERVSSCLKRGPGPDVSVVMCVKPKNDIAEKLYPWVAYAWRGEVMPPEEACPDLTLIMPYYENGKMLEEHQAIWAKYPRELRGKIHVIIVDDGSRTDPAIDHIDRKIVGKLASFRLYRIGVDVRWNWLACRNLGAHVATTDWLLLTDIDHALPADTLHALVFNKRSKDKVYRLSRRDAPHLTPYKEHPNTWLMTRDMYFKIGGYDERFSGYYGTDYDFRDRVANTCLGVVMLSDYLIRYPREHIPDASTTRYGRKEQQDRENVARIRAEIEKETPRRTKMMTFPWEQLI